MIVQEWMERILSDHVFYLDLLEMVRDAGMKLFGEFNIRPAGSLSQLATRYETSLKLGLKYAW